jgi:histidine triad (HIT) family protein
MDNCVFCKIAAGDIPCNKIYEDENFLAFLDINPISVGHTLLIPKTHYRWVYDLSNFGEYWQVAQKIALSIKNSSLNPEYISFLTMGNEVPHAHIHIIPQSMDDSIQPILSSIVHLKPTDDEFLDTAKIIRDSLTK